MTIIYPCLLALAGTLFTYAMTTAGAATVFLVRKSHSQKSEALLLGFAAGVMLAASIWSLLLPALDRAQAQPGPSWLPVSCGFLFGCLFFYGLDVILLRLKTKSGQEWSSGHKLMTAITLHNVPEGMAVGLSFAMAASGKAGASIAAAVTLAIGIGVQNFPEGAAVALPFTQSGISKRKAFWYGSLSGLVEPIGGVLTVLVAGIAEALMPWLLAFAAGAMIYVTVDELIPGAHQETLSSVGTFGAMAGFLLMMILDIALG